LNNSFQYIDKYLAAFVNSNGGAIYFGIRDNGIVIGTRDISRKVEDEIQLGVTDKLKKWKCADPKHNGKKIRCK